MYICNIHKLWSHCRTNKYGKTKQRQNHTDWYNLAKNLAKDAFNYILEVIEMNKKGVYPL